MEEGTDIRVVEEMTNYSSSEGGLLQENFIHDESDESGSSSGDSIQWEDIGLAMTLLMTMVVAILTLVGVFLLWVGLVSRVLGQDLRRDPRYVYACSSDRSEKKLAV